MSETNKNDEVIVKMIHDFLRWPLPKSVRSDGCALVQQEGRTGTNLLSAVETTAMMQEVIRPHMERAISDMETDRNRWRSVAEQAEKALETIALFGETEGSPFALSAAKTARNALAAFDSLRKEGKQ